MNSPFGQSAIIALVFAFWPMGTCGTGRGWSRSSIFGARLRSRREPAGPFLSAEARMYPHQALVHGRTASSPSQWLYTRQLAEPWW